jgi:hypothetical protein
MNLISTEPIFHVYAELADIRDFGHTPLGHRRVIDIMGGHVDGPKLSGRILLGADWQIVWAEGTADLKARYGFETATGARVLARSDGLRHGPADVLAALARGEPIDPSRYYFRTVMRFEPRTLRLIGSIASSQSRAAPTRRMRCGSRRTKCSKPMESHGTASATPP